MYNTHYTTISSNGQYSIFQVQTLGQLVVLLGDKSFSLAHLLHPGPFCWLLLALLCQAGLGCNDGAHFEVAVAVVREVVSCDCSPRHREESDIVRCGAKRNDPVQHSCELQVAVQEYQQLHGTTQ